MIPRFFYAASRWYESFMCELLGGAPKRPFTAALDARITNDYRRLMGAESDRLLGDLPPGRGTTRGDTDGKTSRTVPVRSSFLDGAR